MGITSLQPCMDSSDWLQGAISDEGMGMGTGMGMGMDDSSSPTCEDMLTCSRPLMETRLRPQHEQSLKCPRCESTHTKFCYYNNYSLSQPRYFCKTCRRYWTKGGTLRNIPVGGGCRKNKKISSKKSSPSDQSPSSSSINVPNISYNHANATLAFPEQIHFSHLHSSGLYEISGTIPNYGMLDGPTPIDFMDNKYEALLATHDHNVESYGGGGSGFMTPTSALDQMLMLPYHDQHNADVEVKPSAAKVFSLEWQNPNGYNFGSWGGLMNGYGSNPLV